MLPMNKYCQLTIPFVFQVCFKHPDLLKQAREACVAKRNEVNDSKLKQRKQGRDSPIFKNDS
jgi:hypothetical protein